MERQPDKMNNSSPGDGKGHPSRPLHLNFDLYTDGDPEYKRELGLLIIANLREFQRTLPASFLSQNKELFVKACHKMKVTLSMLEDNELNNTIDALAKSIGKGNKDDGSSALSSQFEDICDLIISAIRKEINLQRL